MGQKKDKDPAFLLQQAMTQLEEFVSGDASLEVEEGGRLVSVKSTGMVGFAQAFIGAFFPRQVREAKGTKLYQIKIQLLAARDRFQSLASYITKLQQGDSFQQKLAQQAIDIAERYNKFVMQATESKKSQRHFFYNTKEELLKDKDIQGKKIRLPETVCIQYSSDDKSEIARRTLEDLRDYVISKPMFKGFSAINSTHIKSTQVMTDAFRMKAIRHIQEYFQQSSSLQEIMQLVRQTPITIEDNESQTFVLMRQILEILPGSIVILTGSFKKGNDSKLMSIPILADFHFTFHTTQTGFPYPGQHTSWALANSLIAAAPLRQEQVPCFSTLEERQRVVGQKLLFDVAYMTKAKEIFKQNKQIFNSHAKVFVELHRRLHEQILKASRIEMTSDLKHVFESFYAWVDSLSAPFEVLTQIQQTILHCAIVKPEKKLQEDWLQSGSMLRSGSYQDKQKVAIQLFQQELEEAVEKADMCSQANPFIQLMSRIFGQASQSITLQYMSEKIGFAPSMLSDFEQMVQVCSFQQLMTFLDELEDDRTFTVEEQSQKLKNKWEADIKVFEMEDIETLEIPATEIVCEIQQYFNLRFYEADYRHQS